MKAESYQLSSWDDVEKIQYSLSRVLTVNVMEKKQKIGVLIQNAQEIRNLKQNRLIHALFGAISDISASTGTGKRIHRDTIKAALKDRYLGYKATKLKHKIVYELKSTAKLTKKECAEFTNNILEWCEEFNMPIQVQTKDYDYLMGKG